LNLLGPAASFRPTVDRRPLVSKDGKGSASVRARQDLAGPINAEHFSSVLWSGGRLFRPGSNSGKSLLARAKKAGESDRRMGVNGRPARATRIALWVGREAIIVDRRVIDYGTGRTY
jgi:hypothetical protein